MMFDQAFSECDLTPSAFCKEFGISYKTLWTWRKFGPPQKPKNPQLLEKVMDYMEKNKAMRRHPAWGYATDEQIEALKTLGVGPERDRILKQVIAQNKKKGKKK